jgi:hypothetical protein
MSPCARRRASSLGAGLLGLLLAAPPAAAEAEDRRRWPAWAGDGEHAGSWHREFEERRWRDDGFGHEPRGSWREHGAWPEPRRTRDRGHRFERHGWRPPRAPHDELRWHWDGGRWCPPGHRHPPGRRLGWYEPPRDDVRWSRHRRPLVVHGPYYCAPCSRWYGHRHDFDRHVYGHHRVPPRAFEDAVARLVWGLVYFGP